MYKKLVLIVVIGLFLTTIINGCVDITFETNVGITDTPHISTIPVTDIPLDAMFSPFLGIWKGIDPFDGSFFTLVLVRKGDELSGTFDDSFPKTLQPTACYGWSSRYTISTEMAEITFRVFCKNENTYSQDVRLILSGQNDTMTLIFLKDGNPDPDKKQIELQR